MIRKLKIKFVVLSMTSLLVLLASILAGMAILNYLSIIAEADETLELMAQNHGSFPDYHRMKKTPRYHISEETPYEVRYFSVLLDKDGTAIRADTRQIKAIDSQAAIAYADNVIASGKESGFCDDYRFLRHSENNFTRIIFLDCGRRIYTFQRFLFFSVFIAIIGYLTFLDVILFFSDKILKPVAESYEKQKRFITDAGHEIKTPLSIIKADADVLEMDYGKNEWLEDIQTQIGRLSSLTADLIYLSRMEEAENSLSMLDFPFSEVVTETALSFQALAQSQNKTFQWDIPAMISYTGNEKAIRQLLNILLENAMKYSPEGGRIFLTAKTQGKQLHLTVFNTTTDFIEQEDLTRIFERFYRLDASRNTQTGGYGIGLSVALAIVSAHNGKITARTEDGHSLQMDILLPV